jgi:DUF971 family protein
MARVADPKSVDVNLTAGTGVEIEWKDGHRSRYSFQFLRDACPCALCDDERNQSGRKPGEPPRTAPGALPMYREPARPLEAEAVGKYAIRFTWNDGHQHGIYSWQLLRDVCPCDGCRAERESPAADAGPAPMISTRPAASPAASPTASKEKG